MPTGRQDVRLGSDDFRCLLATLSWVLHFCLSLSTHNREQLRAARLPWVLLAGNVQRNGQPDNLLLDEQ